VLVCGGLGGVMEAASRGAARAGGTVVGLLPGFDAGDANRWVTVPIVTGMDQARNVILVRSCDAVIAVGGRYGTLSEVALALKLGKPVVGLGTWRLAQPEGRRVPLLRAPAPSRRWRLPSPPRGGPARARVAGSFERRDMRVVGIDHIQTLQASVHDRPPRADRWVQACERDRARGRRPGHGLHGFRRRCCGHDVGWTQVCGRGARRRRRAALVHPREARRRRGATPGQVCGVPHDRANGGSRRRRPSPGGGAVGRPRLPYRALPASPRHALQHRRGLPDADP
jgi:SLOG-like protein